MTDRPAIGTFTSALELLELLRKRQIEIGLSNEALEELCDWPAGFANKYLGPAHEKWPGIIVVSLLMDVLGVSGALIVDDGKVRKVGSLWRREGRRKTGALRTENPRISKVMLQRATPEVRRVWASMAAHARWKKVSPAERKAVSRGLHRAKQLRARTHR